jgi:hypothetical protein
MTVWADNTSLYFESGSDIYKLNMNGTTSSTLIRRNIDGFAGYYPNILFKSGNTELTWLNCESGNYTKYKFSAKYLIYSLNESIEQPAAVLLYGDGKTARLALLSFGTGKLVDMFSLDNANGRGLIQWVDDSTVVLYDTFNGKDKTYYIDVSRLLTASAAELRALTAEANELFMRFSYTPEPTPEPTEKPDYYGECKIMFNGQLFQVEGNYTDSLLNEYFGEPVSEERLTEVQGDMPRRYHYRTLSYEGLTLSAYQTAGYPPDAYGESWQVTEALITGPDYSTPLGLHVGLSLDEVRVLYDSTDFSVEYNPELPETAYIVDNSTPQRMDETDYNVTLSLRDGIVTSIRLYYIWPG